MFIISVLKDVSINIIIVTPDIAYRDRVIYFVDLSTNIAIFFCVYLSVNLSILSANDINLSVCLHNEIMQ